MVVSRLIDIRIVTHLVLFGLNQRVTATHLADLMGPNAPARPTLSTVVLLQTAWTFATPKKRVSIIITSYNLDCNCFP